MSWLNPDGLYQKFGREKADTVPGGEVNMFDIHTTEFYVQYTDLLSATPAILGSVAPAGTLGVVIPKGARILACEVLTETAFTSSGTIGSSTLLIGLKKTTDRSTELDHDGFTTASFVGSRFDAVGERTYVEIGTTGVGALVGTTLAENGVVVVSNSAHASHPYTAGEALVKIHWYATN